MGSARLQSSESLCAVTAPLQQGINQRKQLFISVLLVLLLLSIWLCARTNKKHQQQSLAQPISSTLLHARLISERSCERIDAHTHTQIETLWLSARIRRTPHSTMDTFMGLWWVRSHPSVFLNRDNEEFSLVLISICLAIRWMHDGSQCSGNGDDGVEHRVRYHTTYYQKHRFVSWVMSCHGKRISKVFIVNSDGFHNLSLVTGSFVQFFSTDEWQRNKTVILLFINSIPSYLLTVWCFIRLFNDLDTISHMIVFRPKVTRGFSVVPLLWAINFWINVRLSIRSLVGYAEAIVECLNKC